MTFKLSNTVKSVALAGALGLAGLAATATTASAHYTTTRCDGDYCQVLRCDYDGDGCYTVRSYHRDYGYRHDYGDRHDYDRDDYGRNNYRAHWVCDSDGDDCRWVYGYGYNHHSDYHTHADIGFGLHY